MKRFDQKAVKDRILTRLRVKLNWSIISENSNFNVVVSEFSDSIAEIARYIEYLFNETKWDNALNLSSQTHLGSLLGKKPARVKSATGYVIVSTTDREGNNRLSNLGSNFFELDALSNYDDIEKNTNLLGTYTKTLVPWTYSTPYSVPKNSKITSSSGIEFLTTQTVKSRVLQEPYSTILKSEYKTEFFKSQGGWDGIKYIKVPVIQGKIKTVSFGQVKSSKFESFKISSNKVEDASNSISEEYLKFIITLSNGDTEEWIKVNSIFLADSYDKVFEVYTSDDGNSTIFRVGNGITGALLPENSTLTIQYLESLGDQGNVEAKYTMTSIAFPTNSSMIDPRTNTVTDFLSVTNIASVSGGQAAEDDSSYKLNTPLAYMDSYTVGNAKKYKDYISKNSPIRLSKLKIFKENSLESTYTLSDTTTLNDLQTSFNSLLPATKVTALDLNNEAIENAEDNFIKPLVLKMANLKNPSESIEYAEPNFIDLGFCVESSISDSSVSSSDMENNIKAAITLECGIENTDFADSVQLSEVIKDVKSITGVDKLSVDLEAKALLNTDNLELVETVNGVELVLFPFEFNELYNQDILNLGFKNYKNNTKYLLRADLKFINTNSTEKDRTFFLKDNRANSLDDSLTLQELKKYKNSVEMAQSDSYTFNNITYELYTETSEDFDSKDVRIAQFKIVNSACTKSYLSDLESFSVSPSEIRPYLVDSYGKNKTFEAGSVDTALAVALPSGSSAYVYKRDVDYIDGVDIYFNEDYSSTTQGSSGFVAIPLSYFNYDSKISSLEDEERLYMIKQLMSSYIKLTVTASPLASNFEVSDNTLMSVRDSDQIKVNIVD